MAVRPEQISITETNTIYRDFLTKEFKHLVQEAFEDVVRKVDQTFNSFNTTLQSLKTSIDGVKSMQCSLVEKQQEMNGELMRLKHEHQMQDRRIHELAAVSDRIREIEADLRRIESWNCTNNILISNVPKVAAEDCHQIVTKVFEKVKISIQPSDIILCKRIKTENRKKISPILVKLTTHRLKQNFFRALGTQHIFASDVGIQSRKRIYVNDHQPRKRRGHSPTVNKCTAKPSDTKVHKSKSLTL